MTRGPHLGRRDRVEPLADPTRAWEEGNLMRAFRMTLVGAVMLALLGGLGGVVGGAVRGA